MKMFYRYFQIVLITKKKIVMNKLIILSILPQYIFVGYHSNDRYQKSITFCNKIQNFT